MIQWAEKGCDFLRLDMDCVRDILLCVEEHTGFNLRCHFVNANTEEMQDFLGIELSIPSYQIQLLDLYGNEKLLYHVTYCIRADLIEEGEPSWEYDIYISDLTVSGHEFLNDIRSNKLWEEVKTTAKAAGVASLKSLISIASNVATSYVNKFIGLG